MLGTLLNLVIVGGSAAVVGLVVYFRVAATRTLTQHPASERKPVPVQISRSRPVGLHWALPAHIDRQVFTPYLLILAVTFAALGQWWLLRDTGIVAYLAWITGLLLFVLVDWASAASFREPMPSEPVTAAASISSRHAPLLIGIILLAGIVLWIEIPERSPDDRSLDLTTLWLLSIAALMLLAAWPALRGGRVRIGDWISRRRRDISLLAGIAFLAALPRFFDLSRYAWSMSGDEGTFAVTARGTLSGELVNPFNSGPWGYPSLLFNAQGWFIQVFGDSVASARMLSATFGTLSAVAVFVLVRHHFGNLTGVAAVAIAGTFSYHMYWSRDAQDASAPMFFFPLALYFLDRGLFCGHRLDAVIAGLVIALSQFFHPANRLLLVIAAAYAGYAVIMRIWASREWRLNSLRPLGAQIGWLATGIIVGHLPLIRYFLEHRTQFWFRTNEVSVFASGWLERERDLTGDGSIAIMSRQLWQAILLPFVVEPHGHYRPGAPLTGWPLVLFAGFGMALVTVCCLRRQYAGIALAFWITTIGLAFTEGPPMTNRYTPAAPFLAIMGALGIVALARTTTKAWPRFERLAAPAVITVAILIGAWHIHFYFQDPNQIMLYSDPNSQVANHVAREAEALGPGTTVYLAGSPRLYYFGFSNIPYIAPDATGIDVEQPWSPSDEAPRIDGPTLFAFVPERTAELAVVRAWFPDGSLRERFLPGGSLLLTTWTVLPEDAR
jgi:hypothetical protein